jgi:putative flavoprotein involved in K+ transport
MYYTDVAIIGAGQAGLAMSHCLSERNIDHLVFERGEIGERWKSASWDSLRLLTPNWMNALPGQPYQGSEPDGFMTREQFIGYLESYARSGRAPVVSRTAIVSLSATGQYYSLLTDRGAWRARAVVIATGHCDVAKLPNMALKLGRTIQNLHSSQYKRASGLPAGNVLVVGASSSGVQIADELSRSGRAATLAVGKHIRMPRRWAGRDIFWWLRHMGKLSEHTRDIANLSAAIRQPSLQLVGRPISQNIDLATLQARGVRLTGRLDSVDGNNVYFRNDLAETIHAAELKQRRLLTEIRAADKSGLVAALPFPEPVHIGKNDGPRSLSLTEEGITSVIWATGFTRCFDWVELPILDSAGEIDHVGGVTRMPGIYALGFRFLRKRDSNFIGGVGEDARALSLDLLNYLEKSTRRAA